MLKFTSDTSLFFVLALSLIATSVVLAEDYDATNATYAEAQQEASQCANGHRALQHGFSWVDYLVLAAMLVISCGIGVFYGFVGDKQTTSDDFLLGGSAMGTVPMSMSLAASFITAIELLGNPAEMYQHGSQYWMICVAFILVVPLASQLYLPVYMKLRLTSTYEYLQLRFNAHTRYVASGLYILQMVLYTSVAVYAPALALSHVTGLNVYLAVTVVYVVCIFYASQGGMKAVIMTDTFQAAVLVGSILLIVYYGERAVGGAGVIWSSSYNTERLEVFNTNPNPTIRHSFWSVVVGGTFYWMTMFCSNQASIQKYLSVAKISQARRALWAACFGLILIHTINFYTGMIMVAHYRRCDPVRAGRIRSADEMLPLYVLEEMGHMRGVAGFFVAGIFAASLGTVASALNSLAAVTMQDFIAGACGHKLAGDKGALWAKWISIIYGALSFALVFVVEQLGSVMQVAISFNGMVGGVTFGLFSLGMFLPWANTRGAIFGAVTAMALVVWMGVGQQIAIASGRFQEPAKETSIAHCPCTNGTAAAVAALAELSTANRPPHAEVFFLYRVSFLWYSAIGFLVTLTVGMLVSYLTGAEDPHDVDADLISPVVQELLNGLPKSVKRKLNIPLKMNTNAASTAGNGERDMSMKGVVNVTLDISDEQLKPKQNGTLPASSALERCRC